jgi:4-alpha-glucanotransferase
MPQGTAPDPAVAEALRRLDKHALVLAIHDASFPSRPGEDTGRGTPYGAGGRGLAGFARARGFTGLQLGPQGITSRVNPSPYDGSLFAKNPLSIDLVALARDPQWAGLLTERTLAGVIAGNPRPDGRRVAYAYALEGYGRALAEAAGRLAAAEVCPNPAAQALRAQVRAFRERQPWLGCDALYEALLAEHGDIHWGSWPRDGEAALDRMLCCPPPGLEPACSARQAHLEVRHRAVLDQFALTQLVLHRQHAGFREHTAALGLKLYGDLQVGLSARDAWRYQPILLASYRLGAPPSRTNPRGQPWGLSVLDPDHYRSPDGGPGAAVRFVAARVGKVLAEFDGLRIDHPHGLICPWVYRADDPDPFRAVQHGARLFESPDLSDHPTLARYAIARRDQLAPDAGTARYADDWVRRLDPEQVDRYAVLLDVIVEQARAHRREIDDLLCEVLSTQPYPLGRVIERYGLGRFRVTQKARLDDPDDGYRSENARPEDWIMVGNHDTPPLWRLVRRWQATGEVRDQADYLARRLRPRGGAEALARDLKADPGKLAHAKFADLFASRARHVMVFFPDLLGMEEVYNVPGTFNEENWTLRVPPDYAHRYATAIRTGLALNLPAALALALEASGPSGEAAHRELAERLWRLAGWRALAGTS